MLPCALPTHIITQHVSRNRGFVFSTRQYCGHDMIRSAGPRGSKWKPVRGEFRLVWRNTDPNQYRREATRLHQENATRSSLILDFLQVTTAALYWDISDYLILTIQQREVILRLKVCNG